MLKLLILERGCKSKCETQTISINEFHARVCVVEFWTVKNAPRKFLKMKLKQKATAVPAKV